MLLRVATRNKLISAWISLPATILTTKILTKGLPLYASFEKNNDSSEKKKEESHNCPEKNRYCLELSVAVVATSNFTCSVNKHDNKSYLKINVSA